jgi:hypothetical protein
MLRAQRNRYYKDGRLRRQEGNQGRQINWIDTSGVLKLMGKERLFGLFLLFALIVIFIQYNLTIRDSASEEDILQGWIQISNRIGRAGAVIYLAGGDVNLLDSQQFSVQPQPSNRVNVDTLDGFIDLIKRNGSLVVYRQGDTLICILGSFTWCYYTPQFYRSQGVGLFR